MFIYFYLFIYTMFNQGGTISYKWLFYLVVLRQLLSCQPSVTVTLCYVYKFVRDLESIDHLCINTIHRIGLIHKWSIDSSMLKWSVHISVLLSNCKQSITLLSLLVGTTVNASPLSLSQLKIKLFTCMNSEGSSRAFAAHICDT